MSEQLSFPHSPGLLYSAFTYYCGFAVNSGEYKLMGLAPYGEPTYVDTILRELVDLKPDGSFRLDMSYFDYCHGATMTSTKLGRLLGGPPRRPNEPITERHLDVAASIQRVLEEIMLRMARHVHARTGMQRLCLAGGVALNCVGNGRILREGPFEDVWIQPAAGDAGGALGVAQFIWHQLLNQPRDAGPGDRQYGSLLGPQFSDAEARDALGSDCPFEQFEDDDVLCERVAGELAAGKLVGWFQGRMEFGPRALGARSILADPRDADVGRRINSDVKFRESFRPFAPAVLAEHAQEYFDLRPGQESPYMLLTAAVRQSQRLSAGELARHAQGLDRQRYPHSLIPAVTHVDYSARLQTVGAEGGLFRKLLVAFHRRTGMSAGGQHQLQLGLGSDCVHAARSLRSVSFFGARRVVPGTLAASKGRGERARRWRVGRGGLRHSFSLAAHARAHGRRTPLLRTDHCRDVPAAGRNRLDQVARGRGCRRALRRGPGGRGRLLCGTGMAPSDLLYLDASDDPDRLAAFQRPARGGVLPAAHADRDGAAAGRPRRFAAPHRSRGNDVLAAACAGKRHRAELPAVLKAGAL